MDKVEQRAEAQPDWEAAPPGATHYQPHQDAYYKRVSASEWYVWSRVEDRELLRWLPSPGTSDSAEWVVRPTDAHPPPSAPVGVKTLSEFMADQESLHPGIHDKVQAAADELRASLAQQPAAVDEAAAIRAFEEHFEASAEDPSFEGELELWLTAWRKALDSAPQQPAAVDGAMVERIAALLHEEATAEPWTVAGVEHPGPDRDYYRGLASKVAALATQQPAAGVGEEIMVNAAHDVYTLPLQPSGLSSGPRFVVHVPAPEQPASVNGPYRLVDDVVTVNGIALDEVVRLGDRYAATIEKLGMPRAAQVFEALALIGKHALAAQQPVAVDVAAAKRAVAAVMSAPDGISVEAFFRIVLEAAVAPQQQEKSCS